MSSYGRTLKRLISSCSRLEALKAFFAQADWVVYLLLLSFGYQQDKLYRVITSNQMAFMTSYKCPECGNTNYETGQIRVSGGFWSSFFDVGNRRYNTVTCTECGYTKFYRKSVSGIQKIFDFMGS